MDNLILDRLAAVCGYTVKILVSAVRAAIGKYRGTEETNEAFHSGKHECIRLGGIDFSEKGQAYGNNAKHAASDLAFGKDVTIQTHGHDKYKRTIGDMILPDGTRANHTLVKDGWCWWYRKYAPGDTVLEGLENETREARKGLWADPQPVPSWEWRRQRD